MYINIRLFFVLLDPIHALQSRWTNLPLLLLYCDSRKRSGLLLQFFFFIQGISSERATHLQNFIWFIMNRPIFAACMASLGSWSADAPLITKMKTSNFGLCNSSTLHKNKSYAQNVLANCTLAYKSHIEFYLILQFSLIMYFKKSTKIKYVCVWSDLLLSQDQYTTNCPEKGA